MKPDYQFDDPDQTLPVWHVKCQNVTVRNARMPFFKENYYVRAANRANAIEKVKQNFGEWQRDKFSAAKVV